MGGNSNHTLNPIATFINENYGAAPMTIRNDCLIDEIKRAFSAGWIAHIDGSDSEAFAPYPPRRCQEALELYLCSLTDRNAATPSDELTQAQADIAQLREALEWYGEQARLARLIHSGGDVGRNNLGADGGKRARAALKDTTQ